MKKYWKWILLLFILVTGAVTGVHLINPSERYIRAMYIPGERDEHLMIDQKNGTIFTVDMPEDIQGKMEKRFHRKSLKEEILLQFMVTVSCWNSIRASIPGCQK